MIGPFDESRAFSAIGPVAARVAVLPEDYADLIGYIPRGRLLSILAFVVLVAALIAWLDYEWLDYSFYQSVHIGYDISSTAATRVHAMVFESAWLVFCIIVGIIFGTYYRGYLLGRRRVIKRIRAARPDGAFSVDISIEPTGLHVKDAFASAAFPWRAISSLTETKRIFAIGVLGSSSIVLPKRNLDEAFVAALEQLRSALTARAGALSTRG